MISVVKRADLKSGIGDKAICSTRTGRQAGGGENPDLTSRGESPSYTRTNTSTCTGTDISATAWTNAPIYTGTEISTYTGADAPT